ncbi:hypothetical protein [Chryseobacterium sp. UNC8MFCol]|uniref:hypothetical protein n=1 Tax=Chryseobacterium sp. UNC8MFCol TaxID=1340435 RepID=UPI000ADD202F|nr:hypothetical protein [Chryseobacterium sp. UNC8MFCol]
MRNFSFNKIFVIESLDDKKKTGYELYYDILRWKQKQSDDKFQCEFVELKTRIDFFSFFENLEKQISYGLKPIFHFEIHGLEDKSGLSLQNNEKIFYNELANLLSRINILIGNNLFLTLAVCHGAYLLGSVKIDQPAPFLAFIGSFEVIQNNDTLLRYSEFYDEFLTSFNLEKSIARFLNVNALTPNTFTIIETEETFKKVYKNYLKESTSGSGLKNRLKEASRTQFFQTLHQKKDFEKKFKNEVERTKQKFFIKHRDIFFMISNFPANEYRFKLPKKYYEI